MSQMILIHLMFSEQMSSLKGVTNIVEGLVWSYFAVYLKTVLSRKCNIYDISSKWFRNKLMLETFSKNTFLLKECKHKA